MVSFSQRPAVKKDTIFGASRNFFGPSYFLTALESRRLLQKVFQPIVLCTYEFANRAHTEAALGMA